MPRRNKQKESYIQRISNKAFFSEEIVNKLTFSFKYFRSGNKAGESFEEWEKDQILADLNNKLKHYSNLGKRELIMSSILELFDAFPPDSEFDEPLDLQEYAIRWARLTITGKRRLIGFFFNDENSENVFYIVFLDKEHRFAPSYKKHT